MNKEVHAVPVLGSDLSSHYQEVRSFQAERAKAARRGSKIIGAIAGVSILTNLGLAWTVASMVPLQKLIPVFLWNRPDGTVDSSVAMSRLPATQSDALIAAILWEYVRLREGYSYDTARYGYDVVSGLSGGRVRDQYQAWFNYPNPASPQVTVGQRGQVDIEHISTARLAPTVEQIRYRRVETITGQRKIVTTWTATLQYLLASDIPASVRLYNPGGVVVVSYQSAEDSPE